MLRLVPTDPHAEHLDPVDAAPFSSLPRVLARALDARGSAPFQAARRTHRILALHALLDPTTRPRSLDSFAADLESIDRTSGVVDAIDAAIGTLHRAGAEPARVAAAGTTRARLTAALMDAQARSLDVAGLYDPRRLARVSTLDDDVEISRSLDLPSSVLRLLGRTHAERRRRGGVGVRIRVPPDGGDGARSAVLDAWEAELAPLSDAPELLFEPAPPEPPAARIVHAAGYAAEARAVAGVVLDALAAGTPVDRVAVVIDEQDRALRRAIDGALRDAGIATSSSADDALAQPEVQVVLTLLDIAEGEVSRGALVDLLRSPGLHPGAWVADASEASAVARATALAHAIRGLPIAHDPTGTRFAEALVGTPWMRTAVLRVIDQVGRFRAATSRRALGRELLRFIDATRLGDPSARTLHGSLGASRGELGALRALAAGARAASAMRQIADEMVDAGRILPDPPTSIGELGRELRRALEIASIAPRGASARLGAVRVGAAREAVDRGLAVLVVAGLDSNAYDGPHAVDAWLDADTLDRLPIGARPRPRSLSRAILNAELGAAVATAARVVLTRSTLDADGRERGGPHSLMRRFLDGGAAHATEPVSPLASSATLLHARQRSLARLARGEAVPSELVARIAIERERADFFRDATRASGAFSGLVDGPSTAVVAAAVGGATPARGAAVTTIETAATCAFRVLAEKVCGARPFVEVIEADSALERGNLLHDALFLAFEHQRALPPSISAEAAVVDIRRRLEGALLAGAAGALNLEARRMCIDDAMQVVDAAIQAPDDMAFALGEVKFGRAGDRLGALSATSSDGIEIWFEGKIDRVDLSPDRRRARVIDYKSGKAPRARGIGDTSFQLPLYALALRRSLGVEETSGLYLSIRRGGDIETTPRDPRQQLLPADALLSAATSAADAVVRVHGGELGPRPRSPSRCAFCTSRDICRRPAVSATASQDPRTPT